MTNNKSKNKDLIVGLDIGTSKVVCLVGRYDSSDNLEILSLGTYPSSGLKKGVVVNIDATTDAIEKAVEQAQSLMLGYELFCGQGWIGQPSNFQFQLVDE